MPTDPAETSGVPQSTAGPSSSSRGTSGTATASQGEPSESAGPGSSEGGGSGKKSNAGAIAGGVVGGVAGLALIGLLVWFLLRRKNQTKYGAAAAHTSPSAPTSPQMTNYQQPMYAGAPNGGEYTPSQKLYVRCLVKITYPSILTNLLSNQDPADPSTFPSSPAQPQYQGYDNQTTYSGPTAVDHRTSYAPPQGPPRAAYSGAAEI